MTNVTIIIQHPASGERYAAEVGPSAFYDGETRILRVAGPMAHDDDDAYGWLANADAAEADADAEFLSRELGRIAGCSESDVYGDVLTGILADVVRR